MKHLHKLLFVFCIYLNTNAQNTKIEIGSHDFVRSDDLFLPVAFIGSDAKTQFLITNSELKAANLAQGSKILGLEWYVIKDISTTNITYDLYLSDDFTDSQFAADATFANPEMTLVGDDLVDIGQYTGWHTATFTTPFIWDGTDQMVFQVCRPAMNIPRFVGAGEIAATFTHTIYTHISGYFGTPCNATTGLNDSSYKYRPFVRLIVETATLSNKLIDVSNQMIKISSNTSSNFIEIQGLNQAEDYTILNSLGATLVNGVVSENEKIDIQKLSKGVYFIRLKNNTLKFVKH